LAIQEGGERSAISRNLKRAGLTWCAVVVAVGATIAIVQAGGAHTRAAVDGTLTLSAITLLPGIVCLVLSWLFSPPRGDDEGSGSPKS
jgi:hypothetical protein